MIQYLMIQHDDTIFDLIRLLDKMEMDYAAVVSHLCDNITIKWCYNTAGHWPAEPDATLLLANGHVG